jgi:pantoate--beta-alanine ligase
MILIKKINKMQKIVKDLHKKNMTIGFVPTMGFLHKGHISLIKKARKQNDIVIVSIFVNPTQFLPNEDFDNYPRNIELDRKICKKNNVDYIFFPDKNEIYPEKFLTSVIVSQVSECYEGKSRPGHFDGVCTIVMKLLNIVMPSVMYLGQKDAQQAFIIKKMVYDLNVPVKISVEPTIRDKNGLALSSRNKYLTKEQYEIALNLSKSLLYVKEEFENGNQNCEKILSKAKNKFLKNNRIKLDYIDIVSDEEFLFVENIRKGNIVIIAAKVDNIRLIDNMKL